MAARTPEAKARAAETARAGMARLRQEREAAGLKEVRGIWAKPEHHAAIKAVAKALDTSTG